MLADGSGELDEEELKGLLHRANIIFEEKHFEVASAKTALMTRFYSVFALSKAI